MTAAIYIADPPDTRRLIALDGVALIFHRLSGQTHIVAPPAPEILDALGEGEADAETLLARLRRDHEIADEEGLSEALDARLAELEAAGLVRRA
ncbi:MAG: HPr-rel-A system PqqD family peptide chaperone [Parasphingopyxis sp.]|nr:HPr-rel-A system PqqD family peptide chaperone [Sphingomonadales bacterium]